jgi:hypothetical protein
VKARAKIILVGLVSLTGAVLAVSLAMPVAVAGTTRQPVATPTPSIWPFRYVISGPSVAHSGEVVIYRVDRELVGSSNEGAGFRLTWTDDSASFDSAHDLADPTRDVPVSQGFPPNEADLGFRGPGAGEITLRINPGFTGTLTVGIDERGSSIYFPQGSVVTAYTTVTPAAQQQPNLPGTGAGPQADSSAMPRAATGSIAAFGVAIAAAGGWFVRRRRAR